ncbi:alpha/beta hydrolase [Smaragdicoccus niigatensis]
MSWAKSRPNHLANLRMRPITRRLRRELGHEYAVHQVQYRFRGWNPPHLPALDDALATIGEVGSPLILVGHSMGGRVAAHICQRADVAGIVALAPWWPDHDSELITAPQVVTLHGTADSWTSARESSEQTTEMVDRGIAATFIEMKRAGHFMLLRPGKWHELICDSVTSMLAAHRTAPGSPTTIRPA